MHHDARLLPDRSLVMASNHDREYMAIGRIDLDTADWTWLVEDDAHELYAWVSPDASAMVVGRHVDGVYDAIECGHWSGG